MNIETEAGLSHDHPSSTDIAKAVFSLGPDNQFVILSKGPGAFIQAALITHDSCCMQYRDGQDNQYEVSGGAESLEEVVRAFQSYASQGEAWLRDHEWVLMPTVDSAPSSTMTADVAGTQSYLAALFGFEKLVHLGGIALTPQDRQYCEAVADTADGPDQPRLRSLVTATGRGFFHAAAAGHEFVPVAKVEQRFGVSLASRYSSKRPAFLRFATSYWTLKILNEDLWATLRAAAHSQPPRFGQILGKLELDIGSVIFPTPGVIRLPRFFRRRMQRRLIVQSGAAIDVSEFFS